MIEEFDIENINKRMRGALESVKTDFQSLRTGRAGEQGLCPGECRHSRSLLQGGMVQGLVRALPADRESLGG